VAEQAGLEPRAAQAWKVGVMWHALQVVFEATMSSGSIELAPAP
jgi:hypothetical protein